MSLRYKANRHTDDVHVSNYRCIDKQGLLFDNDPDISIAQKPFARPSSEWPERADSKSLEKVISVVKPHVLIGTSTRPGSFTEEVVREMAKHVERPIIFPLSNPTRLHEAKPVDLYKWTDDKALVATGSPFPPVEGKNGQKYEIAECNNATVFPGIGFGCILSQPKVLSDKMLVAASKALASLAPALTDAEKGPLLPDIEGVRDVSVTVASAVIKQAVEEGLAQREGIPEGKELEAWVRAQMWWPEYREYRYKGAEKK